MIITGFFFSKPELITNVAMHNQDSRAFLKHMATFAMRNILSISLPFLILMEVLFPSKVLLRMAPLFFGLFLVGSILGEYAYFPKKKNPIQSIALLLCLVIPLLIILIVPVFYKKVLSNLKTFLL